MLFSGSNTFNNFGGEDMRSLIGKLAEITRTLHCSSSVPHKTTCLHQMTQQYSIFQYTFSKPNLNFFFIEFNQNHKRAYTCFDSRNNAEFLWSRFEAPFVFDIKNENFITKNVCKNNGKKPLLILALSAVETHLLTSYAQSKKPDKKIERYKIDIFYRSSCFVKTALLY